MTHVCASLSLNSEEGKMNERVRAVMIPPEDAGLGALESNHSGMIRQTNIK